MNTNAFRFSNWLLGKDEVGSSNLPSSSSEKPCNH
nr:MAG TPA: hypothetical protein [Caudoviricetes sp.]